MPRPPSASAVLASRQEELTREIARLDALAEHAEAAAQYGPAVAAAGKAAVLRAELASLRAELAAGRIRDPVKRARNAYERAAAQGAWAPAVVLQRRVEELEAKAAAEVAAAQAAVNRDPAKLTLKLQNALRALPDSLREEVLAPFR